VLDVAFPTQYPFKPPTLTFRTKVYHPNVEPDKLEICADSFGIGPNTWSPTQNVAGVIERVVHALADPTPGETPLNTDAAAQFAADRAAFDKEAADWTANFAKG